MESASAILGPSASPGFGAAEAVWGRVAGYYAGLVAPNEAKLREIGLLATRYSLCILSRVGLSAETAPGAAEAFALWLSLVWIIDGAFDAQRASSTPRGQRLVEEAIRANVESRPAPADAEDSPMGGLASTVRIIYCAYTNLVFEYRLASPEIFDLITRWLLLYVGTVRDSRSGGLTPAHEGELAAHLGRASAPLVEYAGWRLQSGAMMCVVYHVALFAQPPRAQLEALLSNEGELLCKLASLEAALYNDLLSLDRDTHQDTPNLVLTIAAADSCSVWAATKAAVGLTDRVAAATAATATAFCERYPEASPVADWCRGIVAGAAAWHRGEPRYRSGVAMMQALSAGDSANFERLLAEAAAAPGDPS
jgi:hypothetical protein